MVGPDEQTIDLSLPCGPLAVYSCFRADVGIAGDGDVDGGPAHDGHAGLGAA